MGPAKFQFSASRTPANCSVNCSYTGSATVHSNTWRVNGPIAKVVMFSETEGALVGTGTLSYRNAGSWHTRRTGVVFTLLFTEGGVGTGELGFHSTQTVAPPARPPFPNTDPATLTRGRITLE